MTSTTTLRDGGKQHVPMSNRKYLAEKNSVSEGSARCELITASEDNAVESGEKSDLFEPSASNVDKIISKYRSLSATVFHVNPADFSFDCALAAKRLKDRLHRLTNSDIIRINDRQFTLRICQLASKHMQEELEQADKQRAEQECVRLRRLMQQGVISADQFKAELAAVRPSTLGLQEAGNRKSKSASVGRQTSQRKSVVSNSQLSVRFLPPLNCASKSKRVVYQPSISTLARNNSPAAQQRCEQDVNKESSLMKKDVRFVGVESPNAASDQEAEQNSSKSINNDKQHEADGSTAQWPSRFKKEKNNSPLLQQFYKEQNLREMYRLADQLLYGRQKFCTTSTGTPSILRRDKP